MSNSNIAPVALFIFNRPELTAKVFERVRAARPTRLLVVADGPRSTRPDEASLCEATRELVSAPDWPCELLTNFAAENLGCRTRLSSGLDWVFQQCPEAIVLEDDSVPCPSFFTFCSEMLRRYRDDPRIMHISGDNYQNGRHRGSASYFFSNYPLSWGWASWSRAWRYYDVNVSSWPSLSQEGWLKTVLDSPAETRYWENIFDRLHAGEIDTWDYQWVFTCWRQGGLSILPNENLVTNIGVGPDATHFKGEHSTLGIPARELGELVHPKEVIRDKEADRFMFETHIGGRQAHGGANWLLEIKNKLALRTRMRSLLPSLSRYR